VSRSAVVQSHLEALMQQVLEVEELRVTPEGYVNVRSDVSGYSVRLRPERDEPHIEVYSIAIREVEADPGLYEAINDVNRRLSHCRMFWCDDQVVLAGEILGASADVEALRCLCDEVAWVSDTHGPRLTKTFGGKTGEEEDE
jgi:hypothetical protein